MEVSERSSLCLSRFSPRETYPGTQQMARFKATWNFPASYTVSTVTQILFSWDVYFLQSTIDNDRNRNCENDITSYKWELQRITDEFGKKIQKPGPTHRPVCSLRNNR